MSEAVSDYVELRGLHGLCPDVGNWGPPPSPAAFLDSGLPKPSGTGSLPLGLSADLGGNLPKADTAHLQWCRTREHGDEIGSDRNAPCKWDVEGCSRHGYRALPLSPGNDGTPTKSKGTWERSSTFQDEPGQPGQPDSRFVVSGSSKGRVAGTVSCRGDGASLKISPVKAKQVHRRPE